MKRKMSTSWAAVLTALLVLASALPCAAQTTYTVTTTADSGDGSLRAAIEAANASPGLDTIVFDLPETELVITVPDEGLLPAITDAVVIDGTTQPGVTLKCSVHVRYASVGLTLACDGSTVKGLRIGSPFAGFGRGILIDNASGNTIGGPDDADGNVIGNNGDGIQVKGGGDNQILNNYIGVTRTLVPLYNGPIVLRYYLGRQSNMIGIRIDESSGNTIQSNFINWNEDDGVYLYNCTAANTIRGNRIGAYYDDNPDGIFPAMTVIEIRYGPTRAGNGYGGIVLAGCSHQVIGGSAPGEGNVIAFSRMGFGISIFECSDWSETSWILRNHSDSNVIQGNDIYYNGGQIQMTDGSQNLIGGSEPGQGNYIGGSYYAASNALISLRVNAACGAVTTNDAIVGNRFFDRYTSLKGIVLTGDISSMAILANNFQLSGQPIDLGDDGPTPNHTGSVAGPNGLQNYPVVTSAWFSGETVVVNGTLDSTPSSSFHVEFYLKLGAAHDCIGSLEVVTDAAGHATFTASVPSASSNLTQEIEMTATDAAGNTSELSPAYAVTDHAPTADAGPDQTVQTATGSATVTLNGTGSSDPDGDALTYVWTEDGAQIVTGDSPSVDLAMGTHTITLTVSDPYGATATDTVEVKIVLVYSWSGVLQPIDPPNADGLSTSVFKVGSTVPVKFALAGASAGITTLAATLSYAKVSSGVVGSDTEAVSTAAATTGNLFRYDAATGQYIFNWSTKGLTSGTYRLTIDLGDGVERTVNLGLK